MHYVDHRIAEEIYRRYGVSACQHYMTYGDLGGLEYSMHTTPYGDEVYHDPRRMGVRTKSQDREIEELRHELKTALQKHDEKVKAEDKELKDLIAHYYNK